MLRPPYVVTLVSQFVRPSCLSGLIYDSFLNHIYKVSFDFKPFKKASLVFSDQNLSHESSECRGQQLQTHGKEL